MSEKQGPGRSRSDEPGGSEERVKGEERVRNERGAREEQEQEKSKSGRSGHRPTEQVVNKW